MKQYEEKGFEVKHGFIPPTDYRNDDFCKLNREATKPTE